MGQINSRIENFFVSAGTGVMNIHDTDFCKSGAKMTEIEIMKKKILSKWENTTLNPKLISFFQN
jgi:hypothetical protein